MTILRTMSGQSPKISQDEAISIADKLLGRDNSLSKSAGAVRCEVLTRPSSKISKSGTPEQDTMMYVLNYGNSDGYAVVCADVRVPDQVFAYSDTGEMDTQTDNPGVQMFMDMAQDYMDFEIAEVESKRDSVEEVLQGKLEDASDYQGKHLSKSRTLISSFSQDYWRGYVSDYESLKPMLRTYWNQEAPYNNNAPLCHSKDCANPCSDSNCRKHCAAGCQAIAVGQLLAYWQYPKAAGTTSLNWNSLIFASKEDEEKARDENPSYKTCVAALVKWAGVSMNTVYGCANGSGSSAFTDAADSFLRKLGYKTSGVQSYYEDIAVVSLRYKRPVLIRGSQNYNKTTKSYSGGHIWLLDGFIKKTTIQQIKNMLVYTYRESNGSISTEMYYSYYYGDYTDYSIYFHCNWGWGSNLDGYYLSNVFDTGSQYREDEENNKMIKISNPNPNGNYKYLIQVIHDVYR